MRSAAEHWSGRLATDTPARDKAVRQNAEPTDAELGFIFSRSEIRLNRDYDVKDLEPLTELGALETVNISYWGRPPEFFAPIARLKRLKELECEGNRLPDLSFAGGLTELTKLNVTWNQLTTLAPLTACRNLEELRIGRNPLTTIDEVTNFAELRVLWCSCRPLTSLAPLESLSKLELLYASFHSLESLSSLRKLKSLRSLDINVCRQGRQGDKTLSATRSSPSSSRNSVPPLALSM